MYRLQHSALSFAERVSSMKV